MGERAAAAGWVWQRAGGVLGGAGRAEAGREPGRGVAARSDLAAGFPSSLGGEPVARPASTLESEVDMTTTRGREGMEGRGPEAGRVLDGPTHATCRACGVEVEVGTCCPRCDVYHGDACPGCGERGYHDHECSVMAAEAAYL